MAIAGLFTSVASAADLYVRENGTGGAYSTVSAAITAAANGDRIIIQPKITGAAYVENLTINKSLTFMSETAYNKYFIKGTVTIVPAVGRVVNISNLSSGDFTINNITVSGPTTGGRTTLNIMNSYLNNVFVDQTNTTLNLSGCEVSGGVTFSHGKVTGNEIQYIRATAQVPDNSLATDDVMIIGNKVSMGITNYQSSYAFKILNNFSTDIFIFLIKTGSDNEIINNTVYRPHDGDVAPIYISLNQGNTGAISVMNNAVSFVGFSDFGISNNSIATVTASYNIFTNSYYSEGVINSNNTGNANMNFDAVNYTVMGMNENAGNPAVIYTDLDLTRNDAGHNGGSNSWENYWPVDAGGKPQVNYLVMPRIITGGTLNISGSGYSK